MPGTLTLGSLGMLILGNLPPSCEEAKELQRDTYQCLG